MDIEMQRLIQQAKRCNMEEEIAAALCPIIYIVTCGEYSDYRIEGVFLTEARADARIKTLQEVHMAKYKYKDGESYDIKKCVVNKNNMVDIGAWTVEIGFTDPDLPAININYDGDALYTQAVEIKVDPNGSRPDRMNHRMSFKGYGKTLEHARRSADQAVREWKAMGWTPMSYYEHVRSS